MHAMTGRGKEAAVLNGPTYLVGVVDFWSMRRFSKLVHAFKACPIHAATEVRIELQSENGLLGIGPYPTEGEAGSPAKIVITFSLHGLCKSVA